MSDNIYYDFGPLLSRNGTYNFIVGGRGIGKSYGAKKRCVARAIKHGEEFIYMRRFKEELKTAKGSFFADIQHEFPNFVFKVEGDYAYYARATDDEKNRKWVRMGYFYSLTTTQTIKSTAFPLVKTIVYDEFIAAKGRRDLGSAEFNMFNDFYNTVDRFQDRVRVLFLANSVSIMNPYFLALDIRPDQGGEWLSIRNGFGICHFPEVDNYKAMAMGSKFGRFIKDTEYENYAIGNKFGDAHHKLIGKKGGSAIYWYTLDTGKGLFALWQDRMSGELFIQSKRPKDEVVFVLDPDRVETGRHLLARNDARIKFLRTMFERAMVVFDKPATRNIFLEVFK